MRRAETRHVPDNSSFPKWESEQPRQCMRGSAVYVLSGKKKFLASKLSGLPIGSPQSHFQEVLLMDFKRKEQ